MRQRRFGVVKTIASREFSFYLSNPAFYAVLVAYLIVPAYFCFRSVYVSGDATMRPLFDTLPWAVLLFIPALTMRLLSEERRNGFYDLTVAHPVTEKQIVYGKFLGVFGIILLVDLLFLVLPLALSPFGSFDWGRITAQFIGLILFSAFIAALGVFVSSLTANQFIAYLATAIAAFVLYGLSFQTVLLAAPGWLREILLVVSPVSQYTSMARGVIDLAPVTYFVAGSWLFLSLAELSLLRSYIVSRRDRIVAVLLALLSLVVVTAAMLVSLTLSLKADLTAERLFTLSDSTRKVLGMIEGPVVIKVYASRELPPEMENTFTDLKDLLFEYRRLSRGRIQVEYLAPDVNPKAKIEAGNYGIPPVQFNVISQEELKVKEGYLGLAILYRGDFQSIPLIASTGEIEFLITSSLYGMVNPEKTEIGFVGDGGARTPLQGVSILAQVLNRQYKVEELFSDKDKSRLYNMDVLVLAGPLVELDRELVDGLKEYVKKGGALLVAVDPVRVDQRTLTGQLSSVNVNDITSEFGIVVDPDVVMDLQSHENVAFSGQNTYVLPYPFWVRPQIASNKTAQRIAGGLRRIVLLWPASLEIHSTETATVEPVLKTTSYAAAQFNYFMLDPDQNYDIYADRLKEFTLAAVAETTSGGRLAVVGDADFLDDSLVQQNQENLAFAFGLIDWLAQDEILSGIDIKNVRSPALTFPSRSIKEIVRYVVFAFLVLAVVAFGLTFRTLKIRRLRRLYA